MGQLDNYTAPYVKFLRLSRKTCITVSGILAGSELAGCGQRVAAYFLTAIEGYLTPRAADGGGSQPLGRSSAARSHFARSAAASYVLSKNSSTARSGSGADRTISYGRIH